MHINMLRGPSIETSFVIDFLKEPLYKKHFLFMLYNHMNLDNMHCSHTLKVLLN